MAILSRGKRGISLILACTHCVLLFALTYALSSTLLDHTPLYHKHISHRYNTSGSGGALVCDFEYANVFINAASELVGVFMAIQVVDRIGRPATMMWTFGLSAITALIMGLPAEYISAGKSKSKSKM